MNVLGIIAEYNPFHTGHQFHIETAKKLTGAEAVVVMLSGNFVQRGEPALLEKHLRARMAVEGNSITGADLVLELPVVYSAASAEYFAWGGVSALHATGIVNTLSFGAEASSFTVLQEAAQILSSESSDFQNAFRQALAAGSSYPSARISALEHIMQRPLPFLREPNNILAVEYLKANEKLGNPLKILPVRREGASYHEVRLPETGIDHPEISHTYPSSTAIRQIFCSPTDTIPSAASLEQLRPCMPSAAFSLLQHVSAKGEVSHSEKLFLPVLTLLRTQSLSQLRDLPYVAEGLEYRCKQAAQHAASLQELIASCASVRYPQSRIRRIFTALLTGMTAEDLVYAKENPVPYLKVLAFNERGRLLLKEMKQAAALPVITKPAALHKFTGFARRAAELESNATDFWSLSCSPSRPAGQDYQTTPLYLAGSRS